MQRQIIAATIFSEIDRLACAVQRDAGNANLQIFCTFESAFIIIVTRSVSHFGSRIQLKQDGARSKQDGARY